ncbi:hypothetical protein AMTR_s00044p00134340 [Amborella trichopoda]|uniref:Uncharacterized protein n=1 Tax=Amborella trichopoda TaxID=13333 RepID=U5D3Z1_AMBTC|nr:hypothetical protein AMTR_s00044p00134340 [Amborella trichopoda]
MVLLPMGGRKVSKKSESCEQGDDASEDTSCPKPLIKLERRSRRTAEDAETLRQRGAKISSNG